MAKLNVGQLLAKAESHLKKSEFIKAQFCYATIIKSFPNNKKAHKGLTELRGMQGRNIELNPPKEIIDQLMVLYNQGRLILLVEEAENLIPYFPNTVALWNFLGAASAQIGHFDRAIQAYKRIISFKPDDALPYYNLGNVLRDSGKLDGAIEAYAQALAHKPDYELAYNNLRIALQGQEPNVQQRYERTIERYKNIFISKTQNASTEYARGLEMEKQGKFEEAITAYSQAVLLSPSFRLAHNNLGNVFYQQGKLNEALNAYEKCLLCEPVSAEIYSNIGNVLKDQGKLYEAIEYYKKTISLKPDFAHAYCNMGVALVEQGMLEDAEKAYKKALVIEPGFAEASRNLVKLPVGIVNNETISLINKNLSSLLRNMNGESERLFFEANFLLHQGRYADAYNLFVQANEVKMKICAPFVKASMHAFSSTAERIDKWVPSPKYTEGKKIKKLFLLGPSRSGKSMLENLLLPNSNVCGMFENINLKVLHERLLLQNPAKKISMSEIFYHDEKKMIDAGYELLTTTSPRSVLYIDELIDNIADTFCVFIKRDRADVAPEMFMSEYKSGNYYSYNNSNIIRYLDSYDSISGLIKEKLPKHSIEVSFDEIQTRPQEVLQNIKKLTSVSKLVFNRPSQSIKLRNHPLKVYYQREFLSTQ